MFRPRHLACAVALALASSAAFAQTATHAGIFNNMVVFGDSLSDDGNASLAQELPIYRWTTNPGHTGLEDFGDIFGTPLSPALADGNDFAFGGAGIVNNDPGVPFPTLQQQLGMYLGATGNKADPNTLYAVWGGANDIFYAATSVAAAGIAQQQIQATINGMAAAYAAQNELPITDPQVQAYITAITPTVTAQVTAAVEAGAQVSTLMTPAQAQAAIQQAAVTELGMIKQLGQAGAKYVMVVNLPNIGITPAAAAQGPTAAQQLTGLSIVFNTTLNAGLAGTGVNIIPVNAFGFLNEVIANPGAFGFTNVTTPACTGSAFGCVPAGTEGASSTYQPGTDQTYVFADGVHPTTAAHAMLAQYAESIVIAPGQMSLLAEAPLAINEGVNRTILDQTTTSLASAPGNGLRVWANYDYARQRLDAQVNSPKSSNDVNTLSFGADLHPSDAVTAGLAFTVGQQRDNFAGGAGGFKVQDILASGYAMWNWQQAYFGAIGSFGHLGFKNIQRTIPIGPATLFEGGNTSGSHTAFALTGGWWFNFGDWRTGPFADLSWQHVSVDGFSEDGNDATAMTFGRQSRHALVGTLGWQLTGNLDAGSAKLHPYLRASWNRDNDADARDVSAGLVSMSGTFALPGYAPDKSWGNVGIGLSADFTPTFSGWIGYNGRFSDSSQRLDSLNIGAKISF